MTRSASSGTRRSARVRCAVYTRKSSEEGLDQEFNSLRAQREACEAFISSQAAARISNPVAIIRFEAARRPRPPCRSMSRPTDGPIAVDSSNARENSPKNTLAGRWGRRKDQHQERRIIDLERARLQLSDSPLRDRSSFD